MKSTAPIGVVLTCSILWATSSAAELAAQSYSGGIAEGASPELEHWAELIGQWSTEEESLKPDGSGWEPSRGADWEFSYAFGGWGIQDNYTSPPLDIGVDDERTRQRGTNLRIYNTALNKWVTTWLTTASPQPETFSATSDGQEIVMRSEAANSLGFHSRITFFDITESSFEWKLEWSQDQEKWKEVYRIHATRRANQED